MNMFQVQDMINLQHILCGYNTKYPSNSTAGTDLKYNIV